MPPHTTMKKLLSKHTCWYATCGQVHDPERAWMAFTHKKYLVLTAIWGVQLTDCSLYVGNFGYKTCYREMCLFNTLQHIGTGIENIVKESFEHARFPLNIWLCMSHETPWKRQNQQTVWMSISKVVLLTLLIWVYRNVFNETVKIVLKHILVVYPNVERLFQTRLK